MKVFKSVFRLGGRLYLRTAEQEVEVSERKKKTGTLGSIWSETFAEMAGKQGEWILDKGKLRAGVSALVLTPDGVILNRFDSGHPTAPNKLSLPAGIWEGKESLFDAALRELGEEVILNHGDKCGFWNFKEKMLSKGWVEEYAKDHRKQMSGFRIEILELVAEGTVQIYLDGKFEGEALLAYEPETGGIEIIFVFETNAHVGEMLRDGERFKDQWLHREVGVFTLDQLLKEDQKTTKVEAVEVFLRNL